MDYLYLKSIEWLRLGIIATYHKTDQINLKRKIPLTNDLKPRIARGGGATLGQKSVIGTWAKQCEPHN